MKKIVVLFGIMACLALTASAQTKQKKITIFNTRIVQALQTTTLKYAGVNITVPQGRTVILGQRSDGSIVIRGKDLSNIQIGDSIISTQGYSVFSVEPQSNVVFLNRGTELTLQDPAGTTATIYPGQAVSADNAAVTSETAPALQAAAAQEAAAAAALAEEVPAFIAESETSSTASEQATQDVTETEETLSPSAP